MQALFLMLMLTLIPTLVTPAAAAAPKQPPADLEKIAADAYVFGYPLVLMEITEQVLTNTPKPAAKAAPLNQFAHIQTFPRPEDKEVVRPNVDTLYSFAWLDLSREPVILHLPEMKDRYYLMQMMDAWTNVFASIGTRTTGEQEGDFAVVGPKWRGALPAGVKKLQSPTNSVWIIGRTLTRGPADYAAVHAIQAQYTLTPLSAWGKQYSPPAGKVDPSVDMQTPPVKQAAKLTSVGFFKALAAAMKTNPPAAADAPALKKFAALGLIAGKDFNPAKLKPAVAQALEAGVKQGRKSIEDKGLKIGVMKNGWQIPQSPMGAYGTDYEQRAAIALFALGANLREDAVYPTAYFDQEGKQLTGKQRYVLHFDKEQLPAVKAFWSLTMYDKDSFLATNPINRYGLGDRDPLKFNADGSLDLYLQNQSPGPEKEANWLPTPADDFNVTLRLYWPKQTVLDGVWAPPAIKRVD
jgi:DNA sulfur modification protein DndE